MTQYLIAAPVKDLFTRPDQFKAIFNGKIYIGAVDQDPLNPTNQISVYVVNEDDSRTQVTQPIPINSGGYATYNGTPAKFVCDTPYSIVVLDKNDAEQWRAPDIRAIDLQNVMHNDIPGRSEVGAHDDIYKRVFASVDEVISYTGHAEGLMYKTKGTDWLVTSDVTSISLGDGLYLKPTTPVRLNDFNIDGTDDSASILLAALAAQDGGVGEVWADNTEQIGVIDIVDLTGISNVTLDFKFASFIDNVQTYFPASGANRAKPAFIIHDSKSCKVKNISWSVHPSRATNSSASVPDILVWVGGQYIGTATTTDTEVSGIVFNGTLLGNMPICVFGEHRGFKSENIDVYGDASYGINFEYGLAPSDPAANETMSNGKHPYNAQVRNFNGWELQNCSGFLRVASCYSVLFEECQGYNVNKFFYVYGGDRNISRFSQNVKFLNCKSKIAPALFSGVNIAISVLFVDEDGSTGDPLPSWTNYDHTVTFELCEVQNNFVPGAACLRYSGSQGKILFKSCILKNSYYGVDASVSANPSYISEDSLIFEDCILDNNYQDFRQNGRKGIKFVRTDFKNQHPLSALFQIEHRTGAASTDTIYEKCKFKGQPVDRSYCNLTSFSNGDVFDDCEFEMFGASPAITSVNQVYGNERTKSSNDLVVSAANTDKRMYGLTPSGVKTTSGLALSVYDYRVADVWIVNSTIVLDGVTGSPSNGDKILFRGNLAGSNATFNHAVGGTGRFLNKSGANDNLIGNNWSREYVYYSGVWYEV